MKTGYVFGVYLNGIKIDSSPVRSIAIFRADAASNLGKTEVKEIFIGY